MLQLAALVLLVVLVTPATPMASARGVAHRVLLRCAADGTFVERALVRALPTLENRKDRARATKLVYGVLRHQKSLNYYLSQLADLERTALPPATALQIGAYELLHTSTPDHLAVNAIVGLIDSPGQRRFVNGVLRNLATQRDRLQTPYEDPTLTPLAALAIATSTPDWLLAALSESGLLDFDELGEWARATQQRPQLALRINTLRTNRAVVAQRLRDVGCALTEGAVAPLPECVVVEASGRAVDALPGFADGDFTVQDVGAQCVALLAAPSAGDLVLDLCAAPGGKTCHLAELMRDHGTLVAVELRPHRAERITENSKRLGLTCVHVVAADASDGDALSAALREHAGDHDGKGGTPLADCVVLDAPCSGSGTLRRNPEYRYRTGAEEPSKLRDGSLVALQANMLDAAARCVAVGGTLTYSVCSPLAAETTEAVAAFLGRHAAFEVVPVDAPALLPYAADCTSLGGARTCLRTWSHRHPADSHFACKMVRRHPSTAAVPVASPSQP